MPGVAIQLFPRMMNYGDASWMLLTAARVEAADALRIGLVQQVVPAAELMDVAMTTAQDMCALSQVSLQLMKQVMRQHRDRNDVFAVTLPQLQEVVATQLLLDFAENIAHASPKSARLKGRHHIRSPNARQTTPPRQTRRRQPVAPPSLRQNAVRAARRLDALPEMVKMTTGERMTVRR